MAPPMPPAAVRGLLLLLAPLAGQPQRGSQVGAGAVAGLAWWVGCRNGSAGRVRANRGHFRDAGALPVRQNQGETDKSA